MAKAKAIVPTPLQYPRFGPGRRRMQLLDTDAPPPAPRETYFAETKRELRTKTGAKYKTPRYETTPGAHPNAVSFVDYHERGPNYSYIDYMKTRNDSRGAGHARELVSAIYEQHEKLRQDTGQPATVHWGQIMDPAAGKLHQEMQEKFPNVKSIGSKYY